jgi:hypothetical protein
MSQTNRKSWFQSEDVLAQDTVTNILSFFNIHEACETSRVCKLWRLSLFNIQSTFDMKMLKQFQPKGLSTKFKPKIDFSEEYQKFDFSLDEFSVKFEQKEKENFKYASIGSMIDKFIHPIHVQKNFREIFVSSYQSYLDFKTLILILINNFKTCEGGDDKKYFLISILQCFDILVNQYLKEEILEVDETKLEFFEETLYFIEECVHLDDFPLKMTANFVKISISQHLKKYFQMKSEMVFRTKKLEIKNEIMEDLSIEELAVQLTIYQYSTFRKIKVLSIF